jgi:hypothetical protein
MPGGVLNDVFPLLMHQFEARKSCNHILISVKKRVVKTTSSPKKLGLSKRGFFS